jgi:TRAP-type C4-dicarboxylate transport system substrate-binding protein
MKLDFVKGKRLASPTRTAGWMLEDLGAAPLAMPAGSVVGALSAGTIDGAVMPWQAALATDLPLHLTNHTIFFADRGFGVTVHALVLNTAKLDALPEDLRRAILADFDAADAAGKAMDEGDRAGLDLAVGRGSNVITLDEKETRRWIDAARPVQERWVGEMKAKGLDGRALLEKARALIEEESRR